MTQKEKSLLLKDLCARLSYGVIISLGPYDKNPISVNSISIVDIGTFLNGYFTKGIQLDFNGKKELWPKPYLRSMSSMTEDEKEEFDNLYNWSCPNSKFLKTKIIDVSELIDWLNAHHFDYRGLIDKGLALEAPEGMYDLKKK